MKEQALAYLVVVLEDRNDDRLDEDVGELAELLGELGAIDVYVLPSAAGAELIEAREKAFWMAKAAGANDIVDMVVPRASIAEYMTAVGELAQQYGSLVVGCGHAGDGNVHLAVFQNDPDERHELHARHLRGGHGARRRDLGRARHRHREEALLRRARRPGEARAHAAHQGRLRPARHPQPGHDLR